MSADLRKILKEQVWLVSRFLVFIGKLNSEIEVYGDSPPLIVTVPNLFIEFQRGRKSILEEPGPVAIKTATTEDNVIKIHNLVLAPRLLKWSEIAETVGILKDRVSAGQEAAT